MVRRKRSQSGLLYHNNGGSLLLVVLLVVLAAMMDTTVAASSKSEPPTDNSNGACTIVDETSENCKASSQQQQDEDNERNVKVRVNDSKSHHHHPSTSSNNPENNNDNNREELRLEKEPLLELGDDILHRIHAALQASGLFRASSASSSSSPSDADRLQLQRVAMEELESYYQQEEQQSDQARQLLLETRRLYNIDNNHQRNNNNHENDDKKPEFPYDILPPPPSASLQRDGTLLDYSLEFVKDWTPPGGGRYAEYADGNSPYQITPQLLAKSDDIARLRRPYIQKAMQHAWDGYRRYAFGYDEVRPQSQQGTNHWGGIAVSLVDALDTLWIMKMHDEFEQARNYVRDELSHNQNSKVSVFETTIRSLGGLLSAYDWSGDDVFLEEAMDLARRLMRAFVDPVAGRETILPFGEVNLQNGSCNMIPWAGGNAILSEFGTLQIEFRYLDQVVQTSETRGFRDKVESIFKLLHEMSPENGLFPYYMKTKHHDDDSAKPYFSNDHYTFGAMADSFYEYMLKIWIQGGKVEPMYREMYDLAMQGMHDELLHISTPSGLTYLADQVGPGTTKMGKKRVKHKMDHLVCFVGGMLALGAYTDPLGLESTRAQRDLQTAKALTYTCYQMYARMNTGISPEYVDFVAGEDFRVGSIAPHYLLRPEAVESFYILNVLTGDPIYREWGWEVFLSIEKYCKTHVAYGSLGNVQDPKAPPRDEMESFFLAETLKYLYLLNDPDSEIDILNKHVFNTEAHPLRIFPVIEEDLRNRQAQQG